MMRFLIVCFALLSCSVLAIPGTTGYGTPAPPPPPPAPKCSCRAPFIDGKDYNLEHRFNGALVSFCSSCLAKAEASTVSKDEPISNKDFNYYTAKVTGNTVTFQSHANYFRDRGNGPFTLKAGPCEDKGEFLTIVDSNPATGKWTIQTRPDKECAFTLQDEQGRYLCAADKSNFAFNSGPPPPGWRPDVASNSFSDYCLFYAHRLN